MADEKEKTLLEQLNEIFGNQEAVPEGEDANLPNANNLAVLDDVFTGGGKNKSPFGSRTVTDPAQYNKLLQSIRHQASIIENRSQIASLVDTVNDSIGEDTEVGFNIINNLKTLRNEMTADIQKEYVNLQNIKMQEIAAGAGFGAGDNPGITPEQDMALWREAEDVVAKKRRLESGLDVKARSSLMIALDAAVATGVTGFAAASEGITAVTEALGQSPRDTIRIPFKARPIKDKVGDDKNFAASMFEYAQQITREQMVNSDWMMKDVLDPEEMESIRNAEFISDRAVELTENNPFARQRLLAKATLARSIGLESGGQVEVIIEDTLVPLIEIFNPVDVFEIGQVVKASKAAGRVALKTNAGKIAFDWINEATGAADKFERWNKVNLGIGDALKQGVFKEGVKISQQAARAALEESMNALKGISKELGPERMAKLIDDSDVIAELYAREPTAVGAGIETLKDWMKRSVGKRFSQLPKKQKELLLDHIPTRLNPLRWIRSAEEIHSGKVAEITHDRLTRVLADEAHEIWDNVAMALTLSPDEGVNVGRALRGELQRGDLSLKELSVFEPMLKNIQKGGEELVNLGILDAQTYAKNQGKYMRRLYQKFLVEQPVRPLAEAFEEAQSKFAVEKAVKRQRKKAGKLSEPNLLKEKKDIDEAIRLSMGEVIDASYSGAITELQINSTIQQTLLQKAFAQIGKNFDEFDAAAGLSKEGLLKNLSKRLDIFDEKDLGFVNQGKVPSSIVTKAGKEIDLTALPMEGRLNRIKDIVDEGNKAFIKYENLAIKQPKVFTDGGIEWHRMEGTKFRLFNKDTSFFDDDIVNTLRETGFASKKAKATRAGKVQLVKSIDLSKMDEAAAIALTDEARKLKVFKSIDVGPSDFDVARKRAGRKVEQFVGRSTEITDDVFTPRQSKKMVALLDSNVLKDFTKKEKEFIKSNLSKKLIPDKLSKAEGALDLSRSDLNNFIDVLKNAKKEGVDITEAVTFKPQTVFRKGKTAKVERLTADDFRVVKGGERPTRLHLKDSIQLDEFKESIKKTVPALGDLEGKYLPLSAKEIFEELPSYKGLVDVIPGGRTAFSFFKAGKTVYSPAGLSRNFAGNLFFAHLAGVPPSQLFKAYRKGLAEYRAGGEIYKKLLDAGVLQRDFATASRRQLVDVMNFRAESYGKVMEDQAGFFRRLAQKFKENKLGAELHKNLIERPTTLYSSIDDSWKVSAYKFLTEEKGVKEAIAIRRIKDYMQDYANIPQWLRSFEANSTMPFLSFQYEQFRIIKNALSDSETMMRMAAWGGTQLGARAALKAGLGVDEKTYEISKEAGYGGWLTFPTPFRDRSGDPIMIDATGIFPFNDLGYMMNALAGQDVDYVRQKTLSSPFISPMLSILFNKEAFSGRPVVPEGVNDLPGKLKHWSGFFAKNLLPPTKVQENLWNATWGNKDKYGNETTFTDFAASAFGMRTLQTGDDAIDRLVARKNASIRAKLSLYNSVARRQDWSDEKKSEKMLVYFLEIQDLIEDITDIREKGGTLEAVAERKFSDFTEEEAKEDVGFDILDRQEEAELREEIVEENRAERNKE